MDNCKRLTHKDLNCSEDEFNNFLIDCWKIANSLGNGVKLNVVVGRDEIVQLSFIDETLFEFN